MPTPQQIFATATMGAEEKDMPELEKGNLDSGNEGSDLEKGEERPVAPSVLDWDGPNDPGNPMNWSKWKKIYHVVPPAIISFSAYVPFHFV